jgi:hypothetical protein
VAVDRDLRDRDARRVAHRGEQVVGQLVKARRVHHHADLGLALVEGRGRRGRREQPVRGGSGARRLAPGAGLLEVEHAGGERGVHARVGPVARRRERPRARRPIEVHPNGVAGHGVEARGSLVVAERPHLEAHQAPAAEAGGRAEQHLFGRPGAVHDRVHLLGHRQLGAAVGVGAERRAPGHREPHALAGGLGAAREHPDRGARVRRDRQQATVGGQQGPAGYRQGPGVGHPDDAGPARCRVGGGQRPGLGAHLDGHAPVVGREHPEDGRGDRDRSRQGGQGRRESG